MDSHTVRNGWLFSLAAFLLTGGWLSLAEAAIRIIFIATKNVFVYIIYICLYNSTNIYCDKRHFAYKTSLLLSRQTHVCRDKHLSQQKFCRGKHTFVATKGMFCCDKHVSVATKIILMAAPANNSWSASGQQRISYLILSMRLAKLRAHLARQSTY